ncbi:MAG: GNAT family N-acetyltransferase [Spirochaetaceae bacterium]|jgi:Leu/Phe-tRNA-protein transferase|nr:GNAT family N-acetyltransferase [Spirochaetaceae bacterium]GMO20906.1 MAG: hypothetical protein Pg6A_07850 [Termitinemataceae bacterium]
MSIRKTKSGFLVARPGDNTDEIIDYIIKSGYEHEFVFSPYFESGFFADLIYSGFLIMSEGIPNDNQERTIIVMPKHHEERSVLFFNNLHVGRSIRRLLPRYELRAGDDFYKQVKGCVNMHGRGWLTVPLIETISKIKPEPERPVKPFAFGLYREGELVAGEFGVITGAVYTSYSGYHKENSSGRAQLVLTALWLEQNGFSFWDLGMPLDYKYTIGAEDLDSERFIEIYRKARTKFSNNFLNQF